MVNNGFKRLSFISIFALVFLAVFSSLVSAAYDVSFEPIKFRIMPEEFATHKITITNYDDVERVYSLSVSTGDATSWVITPSSLKVPAGSIESTELKIFPKSVVGVGVFDITVNVRDGAQPKILTLPVHISLDGFFQDFTPNVALTVDAPSTVDPRENLKVTVQLRNRNQRDLKNLSIRIDSENVFFRELQTDLEPRREKTTDFIFELNPLLSPGDYNFKVSLYYPITDSVISEYDGVFKVDFYSAITPKRETSSSWFRTTDTITLENIGNYESSKEITIKAPWLKRIFMSSDPKGELVRIDGKSYLQWNPSLKPVEVKLIQVHTNYRSLVIAGILIVIGLVLYFLLRSPIMVLKEAAVVGEDDEGISEVKIRVFIKNRSSGNVHNISVTDRIPGITEFVESQHLGSLRPTRVTKTAKKGTILYWDLDRLESYEERIITYRIKSKLKIVGDMSLPKVRVKFEQSSGRERAIISGQPLFIRKK